MTSRDYILSTFVAICFKSACQNVCPTCFYFQVSSGVGGAGGVSDGSEGREGALGSAERETGIVEKLLSTYGFIRCCDRQARLFFHYSQFSGTVEHLKVGDAVDFEMTFDKKSGKPIAVAVAKLCSDPTLGMGHQLVQGK